MKDKKILILFAFMFLISGTLVVSAITGSIGNGRMILYPEVNGWSNTIVQKTILVNNVNDVPVNITLQLDSNASKFIELIDETFILEPDENKKAEIKIKVKKVGTYEGRVNVFFNSIDGKEAGVVLSSTIIVIAKKQGDYEEEEDNSNTEEGNSGSSNNSGKTENSSSLIKIWGISTFILAIILLILIYIWGKKRKKKKTKSKSKRK